MTRILLTIWISLLFIFLNIGCSSSQELKNAKFVVRTFYVATDGNDQWSGTLTSPDLSRNDGPFATLQRARDAIRELRQKGSNDGFTVLVRGGVYQLNETFILEPEDSGTESQPVVYRAFGKEHPILTGTRRISNFEPYKGKIYKANLPGITNDSFTLRQLFAKGKRQTLARFPNIDPLNPIGGGFLYADRPVTEKSKLEIRYQEGTIPEWSNLKGAEMDIYPGDNWTNNILPLFRIDWNVRTITLSKEASNDIKSGNRFFLQNFLEALDSPGEWYFDRQGKALYYWPVNEASLESVAIPVIKSILEIKGKNYGKYKGIPSDIRFEGFTFDGCNGSAIVLSGANKIVIAGNTVHNSANNGIEIQDGSENVAVGNDVYDVGGVGIAISGGNRKSLIPANNRAENNYIHHVGVTYKTSSGILCKGVGNIITHNLIHSTPRVGIWFDGNEHLIEYNHIHDVNQETQDSGMIYSSQIDWTKRGNIVRFNYLHESGGYGRKTAKDGWQTPFDTYGIYLDDWSSGTLVYGNIVANTANGGIFIHGGRDNIVENNIIIEGGSLGQMVYSAWLPSHPVAQKWLPVMFPKIQEMGYTKYPLLATIKDLQTGATMSGNRFLRNILYYVGQSGALYGIYNDIDLATTVSDYNVIYHNGFPVDVPFMKSTDKGSWAAWQDKGLDQHSVIADPLLADILNGNFTLSPLSPALKMGFKQIPFSNIGPYKDPRRACWPIKETY